MRSFSIGPRTIGVDGSCFVIAEIGLGHDGSLGAAHAYIDAVSDAGADAVKFQTHIAAEEGTAREGFRVNVFPQDATRREYWQRTAFTQAQWRGLKSHAEQRGLEFLSSPFSTAAVRMLREVGMNAWKIGSGESNNLLLLEEIARDRCPVLLSTGMSFWREIDTAVAFLVGEGIPIAVMQCTTRYPCPPEALGLNLIPMFAERYGVPVGLSDHSGEVAPGLGAVVLGARLLEVHVTWHKRSFGPDVSASLTIEQFAELVKGVRLLEAALAVTVDKDAAAGALGDMRSLFTKGLVARREISPGTVITMEDLDAKKPCEGIPAFEYHAVVNRSTKRHVDRDAPISWDDLEDQAP